MTIKTISIIGGGWSLEQLTPEQRARLPGVRIGVNNSAIKITCEVAVSMDRLWSEHRWELLKMRNKTTWLRSSALKNIEERPVWLHPFSCDHTTSRPSRNYGTLHGTNSGMCAINLALQWLPERIILWGFDMNRSPSGAAYWYDPYPWSKPNGGTGSGRYAEWSGQFDAIALEAASQQTEIINASPTSAIKRFAKAKHIEELLG